MKISKNHLLNFLELQPSTNELSDALFQLGHEHTIDGDIFDMEFTPNRGDCLSLFGLARDLNVIFEAKKTIGIYKNDLPSIELNFQNNARNDCPKISFLNLEIQKDFKITKYKNYLESYFKDLGISKNNFFTDISNYVAYELGQPTHCYDYEKINKTQGITLEKNTSKTVFKTLKGNSIDLDKQDLVFMNNGEVINLAGVMGGLSTSCDHETSNILLECAYFLPESIIGKSVKYNLHSDASHKFERGVDPLCHNLVLRRFIQIVKDHTDIINIGIHHPNSDNYDYKYVDINLHKVSSILGLKVSKNFYQTSLEKLGFEFKDKVRIPSYRSDIESQNDIAEEIGRVIGYDKIKRQKFKLQKKQTHEKIDLETRIKSYLIDNGFYEIINTPFDCKETPQSIQVDNPLDKNKAFLRTSLKDSMVDNLLFNERRQKDSIKFFEISDVYTNPLSKNIKKKLAIIASGRMGNNYINFSQKIDTKVMNDLFKPIFGKSPLNFEVIPRDNLDTKIKSKIVFLEAYINEIPIDILSYQPKSKPPTKFIQYDPISEFPSATRDFSFSILNPNNNELISNFLNLIFNYENYILRNMFIFDYFYNEKNDELKIGIRFIFQSNKKTLSISEIDNVIDDIMSIVDELRYVNVPGFIKNDSN